MLTEDEKALDTLVVHLGERYWVDTSNTLDLYVLTNALRNAIANGLVMLPGNVSGAMENKPNEFPVNFSSEDLLRGRVDKLEERNQKMEEAINELSLQNNARIDGVMDRVAAALAAAASFVNEGIIGHKKGDVQ